MLLDRKFQVSSTGNGNTLRIYNQNKEIYLKAKDKRRASEWLDYFKMIAHKQAIDFTLAHEHKSFAPVRRTIKAAPLVDGCAYMNAVADAMEAACEEIYIADWWLSPVVYMKRPYPHNEYWRLDKVLKRKAKEGVRIFVLIYDDVNMALNLNSEHVRMELMKIHESIKVNCCADDDDAFGWPVQLPYTRAHVLADPGGRASLNVMYAIV